MAVFLLILKIIGIALLSILGLALLIILMVLFVPIRYSLVAKKGYESKDIFAKCSVNWLFSILHVSLKYDVKNAIVTIRLFGIPIKKKNFLKEEKKEIDNVYEDSPTIRDLSNEKSGLYNIESFDESNEESNEESTINSDVNTQSEDELTVAADVENSPIESYAELKIEEKDSTFDIPPDDVTVENDNKKGIFENIKSKFDSILTFLSKLPDIINSCFIKLERLYNKPSKAFEKLSREYNFYSKFFADERNKLVFSGIIKTLKRLLNSIKPRVLKGQVTIGFDDPATTGTVVSILAIMYPVMPKKLRINPRFDEPVMQGDIIIKGRIFIFIVIWSGVKIYFNRNFKRLVRIYKKHKAKSDNI